MRHRVHVFRTDWGDNIYFMNKVTNILLSGWPESASRFYECRQGLRNKVFKSCSFWQFYPYVIYRGLSENLSSLGKSVEDTLEQYNGTEAATADQDVEDMYANCAEEEVAGFFCI